MTVFKAIARLQHTRMYKLKKKAKNGNMSTNNGTDIKNDNHLIKSDKPQPAGSLKLVEKQPC